MLEEKRKTAEDSEKKGKASKIGDGGGSGGGSGGGVLQGGPLARGVYLLMPDNLNEGNETWPNSVWRC